VGQADNRDGNRKNNESCRKVIEGIARYGGSVGLVGGFLEESLDRMFTALQLPRYKLGSHDYRHVSWLEDSIVHFTLLDKLDIGRCTWRECMCI
jgi:hypothetical protein